MFDVEIISALLGDAMASEFYRTLALFTVAAWIHGRQVRKEIREQIGRLVSVLQQDLDAQKEVLCTLTGRVTKIENHLNLK